MKDRYDLVIVGGGMVGATLALALRPLLDRYQLNLAILEAAPWNRSEYQPSFDARSTALSESSRQLLDYLQLWPEIAKAATPIQHIHVSDRGHPGVTRMDAVEEGMSALGYVVENAWMGRCLYQALADQPSIDIIAPCQVTAINPIASGMALTLSQSDKSYTLTASLVLLADGGRSGLAENLGLAVDTHEFGQRAIIANVKASRSHEFTAYERFSSDGPMALLPLGGLDRAEAHRFAVVYIQAAAESAEKLMTDDEQFLAAVQSRMGYRAGRFEHCGQRGSYPLIKREARELIRPGLALVGNAAHALHPVAGQGFNLALRGVGRLVDCLASGLAKGQELGELAMLEPYAQAQRIDQVRVMDFTDLGLKTFTNSHLASVIFRNAGLLVLDLMGPLKSGFIGRATGIGGMPVRRA